MITYQITQNILRQVPIGLRFDNPSNWTFTRTNNGFNVRFFYYTKDNNPVEIDYFVNFADLILINGLDIRDK